VDELGGSSGEEQEHAAESSEGEARPPEPPAPSVETRSDDQKKRQLADAIQRQVVQGGRVESQSDFQAVIVHGQPVNHTLHVLLSIFTCGLWLIPWLVLGVAGGEKRTVVSVDDYGNVLSQDLGKRR
jgi:hypothetical protein